MMEPLVKRAAPVPLALSGPRVKREVTAKKVLPVLVV